MLFRSLQRLAIDLPVYADDARVKATLQKNAAGCLYFLVNTANEAVQTTLSFSELEDAVLDNVLSQGEPLVVKGSRTALHLPPRSVKVFWKKQA